MRQARQRHFIAGKQRTGVHIVLHQRVGHHDVAHLDAGIARPRHPGEQDVGHAEFFDQHGRSCRSSNLPYTRQNAHSVDSSDVPGRVGPHPVDELGGALHGLHEALLFFLQRAYDSQTHFLLVT